jgi:hypothetical protein
MRRLLSPLQITLMERARQLGSLSQLTPEEKTTADELSTFRSADGNIHPLIAMANGMLTLTRRGRDTIDAATSSKFDKFTPEQALLLRKLSHLGGILEPTPAEIETAEELSAWEFDGRIHELVRLAMGGAIRNRDSALIISPQGQAYMDEMDRRGIHPEAMPLIPQGGSRHRPDRPLGGEPR